MIQGLTNIGLFLFYARSIPALNWPFELATNGAAALLPAADLASRGFNFAVRGLLWGCASPVLVRCRPGAEQGSPMADCEKQRLPPAPASPPQGLPRQLAGWAKPRAGSLLGGAHGLLAALFVASGLPLFVAPRVGAAGGCPPACAAMWQGRCLTKCSTAPPSLLHCSLPSTTLRATPTAPPRASWPGWQGWPTWRWCRPPSWCSRQALAERLAL